MINTEKNYSNVKIEIPVCIPYKNVANMNLVYVYREDKDRKLSKFFIVSLNITFFLCFTLVIVSLWFDLSSFKIVGFWVKSFYAFWAFIGLANLRLFLYKKDRNRNESFSQLLFVVSSVVWILYFMETVPLWVAITSFTLAIIITAALNPIRTNTTTDNK